MAIHKIEELPWGAVRRLAHRGAVFMLSLGPIEDHGPHLPAGVDYILADHFARHLARALVAERPKQEVVLLPALALGAQNLPTLGCLRTPTQTVERLLEELARDLEREGVRRAVVVTTHGALSHLKAVATACGRVNRRGRLRLYNCCGPLILKFFAGAFRRPLEEVRGQPFTDAEWQKLGRDYHAGAWETSMMLQFRPDLVADFYPELPPHRVEVKRGRLLRTMRSHRGYFGEPALADPELGRQAIEALTRAALEGTCRFLDEPPKPAARRSPGPGLFLTLAALAALGTAVVWGGSRPGGGRSGQMESRPQ